MLISSGRTPASIRSRPVGVFISAASSTAAGDVQSPETRPPRRCRACRRCCGQGAARRGSGPSLRARRRLGSPGVVLPRQSRPVFEDSGSTSLARPCNWRARRGPTVGAGRVPSAARRESWPRRRHVAPAPTTPTRTGSLRRPSRATLEPWGPVTERPERNGAAMPLGMAPRRPGSGGIQTASARGCPTRYNGSWRDFGSATDGKHPVTVPEGSYGARARTGSPCARGLPLRRPVRRLRAGHYSSGATTCGDFGK